MPPTPGAPPPTGEEGPGDEAASDPTSSTSSEDELLALADASPSGVKRKAEPASSSTARPRPPPPVAERTSTKRKADEEPDEKPDGGGGPEIRTIETVDAEWHDVTTDYESLLVTGVDQEFEGTAGGTDDMPPSCSAEELAELDEAAEIAEIERLEEMGVLLPDLGDPAEHLSTTFATTWKKGDTWFSPGTAGGKAVQVGNPDGR